MKTDKFEKTIRQKLESISPDFQEDDWAKMQNYMHAHTPPTIWQQYGSRLGYAAAASVTTVMAFLYVNQLSQNNHLVSDVKKLQNQIEVIKTVPPVISKTDTIYIVQKELVKDRFLGQRSQDFVEHNDPNDSAGLVNNEPETGLENRIPGSNDFIKEDNKPVIAENTHTDSTPVHTKSLNEEQRNLIAGKTENNSKSADVSEAVKQESNGKPEGKLAPFQSGKTSGENIVYTQPESRQNTSSAVTDSHSAIPPAQRNFSRTLDGNFNQLAEISAVPLKSNSRQMNYALASRLSARQVKKVWLASNSAAVKQAVTAGKKIEKTKQTENVIPKLNLKVPYRFGGGIQLEGHNQVKTVLGEVLVAKKFSVSAGISWLKVKPMEFFTEKIFRDKNRQDFKRSHPNQVPMAFEILNISVKPTLVQIPLTVAFRNELNHDFSYFVGVGTNVTVKGREAFSFDCRIPTPKPDQQFISQSFERKMDIPVINSLNFSAGIEKTWHPVVVQLEGYVYSYFKPLSPDSPRTGPGVKLKLMYQIGRKM